MDSSEYDLTFFHREGFHRRACSSCGHAFWSLGDWDRCQEDPCTPYGFLGNPGFRRPYSRPEMREAFLGFFERRGHERLRRYPIVARWRNDVFFTQASIYDFQPWVTNGTIPPPANPLTISQPCVRFLDLEEVGRSGRHFTLFEMMAHHAFNRPDHEVYFKERCTELCHELLVGELGADPKGITYKEEEWEGGGNLGPSLSVGLLGMELGTLVFMEYVRDGDRTKPMPLTVVDTGYGLERFTWMSQGTRTAYPAVFGEPYEELRRKFPPTETAILTDHARALNFLLTDGVVPSNSKEGYFARLLIRRMLRILAKVAESPPLWAILDVVGREVARDFPEVGAHRDDLRKVVEAEIERYDEAITRARTLIRRQEDRVEKEGGQISEQNLVEWYDSLGVPPDVAVEELRHPPKVPSDFYSLVAARHESETRETEYSESSKGLPEVPPSVPGSELLYFLDPYTMTFEAHVSWAEGNFVALDRTFFYPTGGGQISDTGRLGEVAVTEVVRQGPWVLHRLERPSTFRVGERVRGHIDAPRRRQLMQHHTATHLLNGALRETLGPHVWQAGAYKGLESARIDITHYKSLSPSELRTVERRVNEVVRENRAVKSYFESRNEAERRFGFTLYQGGAVPGRDLRIVEVDGFDVEACGGTHCTHTSEVGVVTILGTERIQDGIVRLTFAAGERGVDLLEEHRTILNDSARKLGVPPEKLSEGIDRLLAQVAEARHTARRDSREDLTATADRLLQDPSATVSSDGVTVVASHEELNRDGLMELSRILTKLPGRVAILTADQEGKGILFIGSTERKVPADVVLSAVAALFGARGGGNGSAATAVGEPGEPLARAMNEARRESLRKAAGSDS